MAKGYLRVSYPKQYLIILLLLCMGMLMYLPWTDKSLAADDFKVVYDVSTGKIFNFNGFFRPLSDFSFWMNFKIWGTGSRSFFITNLIIHLLNLVLVFFLGLRLTREFNREEQWFSGLAALFFLCYPFHNEPLFWAVGRGASLATFFALSCIYIALGYRSLFFRSVSIFFLYSLGLLAYETIFPLVFILLLVAYFKRQMQSFWVYMGVSLLVLGLHFFLRIWFSGSLFQGYSESISHLELNRLVEHFMKMMARQWAPPMQQPQYFIFATCGAVGLTVFSLGWTIYKNRSITEGHRKMAIFLFIAWMVFMMVASSFPVSTKTSETDRLLYLPSVAFSMLGALLLLLLPVSTRIKLAVAAFIALVGIYGSMKNAQNWEIASNQTKTILTTFKTSPRKNGNAFIIHLPSDYKGAFVFRNGFYQALLLQGTDTSGIQMARGYAVEGNQFKVLLEGSLQKISLKAGTDYCYYWDGAQLNCLFPDEGSTP